jgi:hypothetical protein
MASVIKNYSWNTDGDELTEKLIGYCYEDANVVFSKLFGEYIIRSYRSRKIDRDYPGNVAGLIIDAMTVEDCRALNLLNVGTLDRLMCCNSELFNILKRKCPDKFDKKSVLLDVLNNITDTIKYLKSIKNVLDHSKQISDLENIHSELSILYKDILNNRESK